VKGDGEESVISSGDLGTLKPEVATAAAKQTVSKIFDIVKKRKEAANAPPKDDTDS
jgi:hypothetical protein